MPRLTNPFRVPGLDVRVTGSFRREQLSEATLPCAYALMEGGFVAVVAAKTFGAPPWAIALISASPMFGNLSSFAWNAVNASRPKVPLIMVLQGLVLACLVATATASVDASGYWTVTVSVIVSRLLITGVITTRSVAWSLNYGREVRARATGRLQMIASLVMVVTTAIGGLLLDAHPENFRWLYLVGAAIGSVGVWAFSGVRLVGEKRQRVLERRNRTYAAGPGSYWRILKRDRDYASYQGYQFVSGVAAMSLEPVLVYLVSVQLGASYAISILLTLIIPVSMRFVGLPFWARYLDRVHVARFRATQNALWVVGVLIMWWGAFELSIVWLTVGRLFVGIVTAGGSLAWQLGHNDFAPKGQLASYMGIHITLTGVRGAFAPFLGMALYIGWPESAFLPRFDGLGATVFPVSAALTVVVWQGFFRLDRRVGERSGPRGVGQNPPVR